MRGLFITGTSTDVGKTHVTAIIARWLVQTGYRVGVYKPVASGCRLEGNRTVSDDAVALWEAAGKPGKLDHVCPQHFLAPMAPHRAAAKEGKCVDRELLFSGLDYWWHESDVVLVEGIGGLMSPISDEQYNTDLAAALGLPLVIVSPNELGTINATLQTLITAKAVAPRLPIAGIVLNQMSLREYDVSLESNAAELAVRCKAPLLATVGYQADQFATPTDWFALAGPPRNPGSRSG